MKWISVEDRLPDETRPEVLFFVSELNQTELGKFNESTGKWIVPFRGDYYQNGFNWVTHWMPLPEPPKEQERCAKLNITNFQNLILICEAL